MNSRSLVFSVVVSSVIAVGCTDNDPAASSVTPQLGAITGQAVSSHRGADDEAEAIALVQPGYAGFRLTKDGRVEVFVSKPALASAILTKMGEYLRDYKIRNTTSLADLPKFATMVKYDMAELQPWRRQIRRIARERAVHITQIRIDDRANAIVVGVASTSDESPLVAELARLGIPNDAVLIKTVAPITTAAAPDSFLDGPTTVVRAGVAYNQRSQGQCTLSPTVGIGIQGYFLVNSHCTIRWGAVDTAKFYQPDATSWIGGGGKTIGTEWSDPSTYSCPDPITPIITWPNCRYSDSAIIKWTDSVLVNNLQTFAEIVKTKGRASFRGTDELVPNDRLEVSYRINSIPVGLTLDKVGRTTGWTYGDVTDNDVDIEQDTHVFLLDQVEFTANSFRGDSGSPVFEWWTGWTGSGGPVGIAGIYWGGYFDQNLSYFSPIHNIEVDHGVTINFF